MAALNSKKSGLTQENDAIKNRMSFKKQPLGNPHFDDENT